MSNQQDHWNKKHNAGHISKFSEEPNPLAIEVANLIADQAKVLELGCGAGNDAKFFAEKGFKVIATDFSEVVVQENKERYKQFHNLEFEVLDTTKLIDLPENNFDLIYARLSLHYFLNAETKAIFEAIYTKLKVGGILAFLCKSVKDPLYGQGQLVEENMYSLDGHVRHFFSEEYAKECIKNKFELIDIQSGDEVFYGYKSSFVKVICRKI